MSSSNTSKRLVQPYVLSKQDIEALPIEGFSDPKKCTGGWQQIFSGPDTPTNEMNIGMARFPPASEGRKSFNALHRHKQAEFYYILSGSGVVKIEGVDHDVSAGHALFIPGNSEHGFWNLDTEKELVFLWGFAANGFRDIVIQYTGENQHWQGEG